MIRAKPLRPGKKTWVNDDELFQREMEKYKKTHLGEHKKLQDILMRRYMEISHYAIRMYNEVLKSKIKGGKAKRTNPAITEKWVDEAENYWSKELNRAATTTQVAEAVKKKLGGSVSTIRKYIKHLKPQKK